MKLQQVVDVTEMKVANLKVVQLQLACMQFGQFEPVTTFRAFRNPSTTLRIIVMPVLNLHRLHSLKIRSDLCPVAVCA